MRIVVQADGPGTYSLTVNGHTEMRQESFTVVDRVRALLEHHGQEVSECGEIADAIRARHGLSAS